MLTPLVLAAVTWFGPAKASFETPVTGNPWDDRANDVRVVFTARDGHREERLAWYDNGRWNAMLTTQRPGAYRAELVRNGKMVRALEDELRVTETDRLHSGFIRSRGHWFFTDEDHLYFPIGYNLGWRNPGEPGLTARLQSMAKNGLNWTRIWACAWDGKNPVFSQNRIAPEGEFLPDVLRHWDSIVETAERSGIRFQLVLFHHGLFSTTNDSNWNINPWNRANGGFLARPEDFFTHPKAKEYARRWLRLAVARWGHSPAIMSWELFNEVEWTNATRAERGWETVSAWHSEMAAYLRSIDPYRHLVTSSSAQKHPELYASLDYFQPHTYPQDVYATISGMVPLPGKPAFFGEFGRGTQKLNPNEHLVAREGLWAGVLSGHSGAAQYWFWDRVGKFGFEHEFSRAADMIRLASFGEHPERQRQQITVTDASATAHALGDADFTLARITTQAETPLTVGLKIDGLADGPCRITTLDLDTGAESNGESVVVNGTIAAVALPGPDVVVLIKRVK